MDGDRRILRVRRRLAAPSPLPERTSLFKVPPEIDAIAWAWASWCHTRRYYAPNPRLQCILGRLRTAKSTAPEGPRVFASQELACFHQGVISLPERERAVLELTYLHRAKPIKTIAAALGVSREHVYRIRASAAVQAYRRAQVVRSEYEAANG